jgi:hypothetical protein|tara:strand:+ start:2690 stop:3061 length:372 start_codon:yes stop_codon:yes gene_type:complete
MQIKKERLKAIILEEIAKMQEAGLTGTMDAQRAMAQSDDPFARIARKKQDDQLKSMVGQSAGMSPAAEEAQMALQDMGILNPGKGDPLMPGKYISDAYKALEGMGADAEAIEAVIRRLEVYYR